jgi:uncharacterized membrane protein YuzA (DUF378 family)
MNLDLVEKVSYLLVVIGGINWGLVGWLDYNLVDSIFGEGSVIYAVVGVAALYVAYILATSMSKDKK